MIVGELHQILKFIKKDAAKLIADFCASASLSTANGEYPLAGEEIFAKVLSYQTTEDNNNMVEAHNQYVDVQVILDGIEVIKIYKRSGLQTKTEYSTETDCEFFHPADEALLAELVMKTKSVAILFPQDAHLAALSHKGSESNIKKIVFKVYEKYFA